MFLKKKDTCNIKSKLQVVEMCLNCVGPNCEKRIPVWIWDIHAFALSVHSLFSKWPLPAQEMLPQWLISANV